MTTKNRGRYASAAALLGLSLVACDAIIGIEELRSNPNNDPADVQCEIPTDCPSAGNSCFLRSCEGGLCKVSEAPAGTEVASQIEGDCRIVVCNAEGVAEDSADPTDVSPDGKECTTDVCTDSGPMNTPSAPGTPCTEGVCDGSGECVECVGPEQCGGEVCINNLCVPQTCTDDMKNGLETDVDCGGGMCPPCGVNDDCNTGTDCTSLVCGGSGSQKTCQAPTCEDGVKNGQETDKDCGGGAPLNCPPCGDGKNCNMPTDCQSSVCACEGQNCDPLCQAPTCTDGVKNGTEVAPDCQGGCQGTCDPNEPCEEPTDCGSSVCEGGVCHDCNDGIMNVLETGVDCGGPVCPACPG